MKKWSVAVAVIEQAGQWPTESWEQEDTVSLVWRGTRDKTFFADVLPSGTIEWECVVGESLEMCGVSEGLPVGPVEFLRNLIQEGKPN